MRWFIYSHLAAVAVFAVFSLADRGLFVSQAVSKFIFDSNIAGLFVPALCAWFICPLAVAVASAKRAARGQKIGYGLLAEVVLSIGQLLAVAPACM